MVSEVVIHTKKYLIKNTILKIAWVNLVVSALQKTITLINIKQEQILAFTLNAAPWTKLSILSTEDKNREISRI